MKFTGVESAVRPEIFPSDITQFSGESLTISMSTSTQGAFIFYTLDGSDPDETSNLYTSPFAISNTTTIKAIAVKEGMNPSPIFTRTYTAEKAYDYFDFPMDISGPSGRASFNNTGFGMEENEPCHSFIPNTTTSYYEFHSGWFRWKAHDSGKITFIASCDGEETVGSTTTYYTYPSFVSVYTGGSVSTLTRVSPGTYDGSTYSSSVTINVVKGLVYYIATTISSESGGGEMVLRWSSNLKPLPMPPVFDNVSVGNVTDNSAELSMVVSSYGVGSTNVTLNLYYSETESLDNVICVTNNVECSVPISYVLRDLSLNTKYYVRVVATNDDGLEARSRVLSFVTTGSALIAPIIGVQETSGGSVLGFENTSTGENFVIAISNPQVGVTYVPCVSEAIDGVYSELNEYAVTATESNKTMFIKIPSTSATLFVKIKAHTN